MTQTSGRLLQLLSLLQTRRDWPGDELASRLEVSGRTIRRDVERLRELGYPVQATTGPDGGYRLEAGTAMPPLLLDDDEAVAIAVGLRTAAGASVDGIEETSLRALVKLEQVLPAHLRRRVHALNEATATLSRNTGPTVDPQTLTVIATACRDQECLRFGYRAKDGKETRRLVEPHSLVNLGQRWYFVAWDLGRDAWRTFRIDRIERPSGAGRRFKPRTLPGGDPAAYVSKNLSGSAPRHEARVTLKASAQEIALLSPWTANLVEPIDAVSCEYRATDASLEWLAMRLAMIGVDFEVHEPAVLRDECARLAERLSAAAAP
ncbi:MAG: YafY family transcriptional regulator [Solirubrobacteraceae bacterium]|nr:YafY family transcriptional regulator [Solirubrobacteraceae bacterium]